MLKCSVPTLKVCTMNPGPPCIWYNDYAYVQCNFAYLGIFNILKESGASNDLQTSYSGIPKLPKYREDDLEKVEEMKSEKQL